MNKSLLELRDSIRRRGFWVDIVDGEYEERLGFALTARKRIASEAWDVEKIQDDVFAFATFILKDCRFNNREKEIGL